jgi:hypothetical protein
VLAAACSLVLARESAATAGVRLADLDGDQPAIFGLGADPELGLLDWLAAGAEAPAEALDRLVVEVAPGVALLPRGGSPRVLAPIPAAEAGAALAVLLGDAPVTTIADCGSATAPATRAVAEVATTTVVVIRCCYLALRRAVRSPVLARTSGVVLVEDAGRSLSAREVSEVLDLPVIARVPSRPAVARAVDAGVLVARFPDPLARPAAELLQRVGISTSRRGAPA